MKLEVCLLLFILTIATARQSLLLLNKGSTVYDDVKQIVHNHDLRQVVIQLRDHRRCDSPSFMVRISGTSVHLLRLERHDHQTWNGRTMDYLYGRKSTYYFSYPPLQDPGLHFIEVIVTHCKEFHPHVFMELCLEKPHGKSNVVTLPYSFTAEAPAEPLATPRWVLNTRQDSSRKPILLSTRYQALELDEGGTDMSSEDGSRHAQYDFINLPPIQETMQRVLAMSNASSAPVINICMVGASHARGIADEGASLNKQFNNKLKFMHIDSKFPHQFSIPTIEDRECTYAVVGYGQWPFSGRSYNYTVGRYANEVKQVLQTIVAYEGPTQFFMRSMNYNGLGGFLTTCPPIDHRTPDVVNMANKVMRAATEKHNVEYIDTNHIMAPMWDIAEDWCHPGAKVFTLEAYWILHAVLESSLRRNKPIHLDGTFALTVPDSSLIRFSNGPTVYLYRNKVMRAFPNGATFEKMGFDFGDVKVLKATKVRHFKIGDELPSL